MHPPAVLADLWTTTVRTVLPQRGAIANAREAVLQDRWAAAQRRESAMVAARAAGHPSAAGTAGPDPPRGGGAPCGLALALDELARVADVAPDAGFAAAAETALDLLQHLLSMDLWLVTAVQDGLERVVVARGVAGMPVPPGALQPWAESYCSLMVAGKAPRVAPRVREVPAYAASPATERFGIEAYVGVPLLAADGSLFGALCGLSATERDDRLADALPDIERVARLLSTVLAKEVAVAERSQAAAQAFALGERDPDTGLLNRRGWLARLRGEEERRRRRGHVATVLLVRLEPDVPVEGGHAGSGAWPPGPVPAYGDPDLLRRVAAVLRQTCRATDVVARLGASDFAVLAVDCDAAEAARLARRVRDALRREGSPFTLGMATGQGRQDLMEAWRRADVQVHTLRATTGRAPER